MEKQWKFPDDEGPTNGMFAEIHPLVQEILRRRGIRTEKEQQEFLSDRPQCTYDTFLLKDMRRAAETLLEAIHQKKKICVYGDYDADGICSVSLVMEMLAWLEADAFYYIPSRFKEGYGLNLEAVRTVKEKGAELLLTVDCGSVSVKEVAYAGELGMEVIVTDHHTMGETAADCLLVNPKQKDCPYPDQALCGCGLAFKLAQALSKIDTGGADGRSRIGKAQLKQLLDLAAIATIGDIVPLLGENRTIVKYGMRELNRGLRPGIQTLLKDAELPLGELNAEHVAFGIVPHLNASGRMASAETGVMLLTASEEAVRQVASTDLVMYNRERRRIQEETFTALNESVERLSPLPAFLLLEAPDAHEGITGIVAGKLKDKFYRPTAIVTPCEGGFLKGTGRSVPGVNLYDILASAAELYERFGGHEGACGFLIRTERFSELKERLLKAAEGMYAKNPELFRPSVTIDGILRPEDVTRELIRDLDRMAPFGQCNPKPVLCFRNVTASNVSTMGDSGRHLRFRLNGLECVLFSGADDYGALLAAGEKVDVAGYPGINCWKGRETIQVIVSDVRLAE